MRNTVLLVGLALAVIIIGTLVFMYGQNSSSQALYSPTAQNTPPTVSVPFTELARGSQSTVTARVNYLIVSTTELAKLWKMVDATTAAPVIDFSKNAVIAVFAGNQPSAGYAIAVSKIEDAQARTVTITLAKPDSTCVLAQTTTAPYEIIVVPVTSLPLAHEDIWTTSSCPH
jgi:hypothetical protein